MSRVIAVDLDETLVKTDLLLEGVWRVARGHPLMIFKLISLLLDSKLALKAEVAFLAPLDAAKLPFNQELIDFLKTSKSNGDVIVLATASDETYAQAIQGHLKLFDFVYGSSPENGNLKGRTKSDLLVEHFPDQGFTYVGDSLSDIPIWDSANEVIFAGKSRRTQRAVAKRYENHTVILAKPTDASDWFNQLRIRQWTKNLLVFLPLLLAMTWSQDKVFSGLAAFLAFGFVASSSYIFNDLSDIEADRSHPEKRRRPLARGAISIPAAFSWMVALAAFGWAIALLSASSYFLLFLALYAVLNSSYSLFLKRVEVIDVVVLSILYLLRIVAGGVATSTLVSHWLMVFAFFVFLGLGLLKRYSELILNSYLGTDTNMEAWRGYRDQDTFIVGALGVGFGVLSAGMLALYIDQTVQGSGVILWLLVPLWSLWIMRAWLLAHRGLMPSDPVEYAVRNPYSLAIMLALAAVFYASNLFAL